MGSSSRHGKGLAFPVDSRSFFKIVLSKDVLKFPESVVTKYGDCLGDTVFLKVPNSAVWPVGLIKRNGQVWLQQGWSNFADFYSLAFGYVLLFSYEGLHSHFQVRIFMRSPLEIDYFGSSVKEEHNLNGEMDYSNSSESPASLVNAPSFFKIILERTLQDGMLEIPIIAVHTYGDYIADTAYFEVPDGSIWPIELTRRDREICLGRGWPEFAKSYSLEDGCFLVFSYAGKCSHFQLRIFRKNTLEMEYNSSSDDTEGNSNTSGDQTEGEKRTHGGDGGKTASHRSSEVDLRTAKLESLKGRAFAKASSFKYDNPFTVIRMQPSYVLNHLRISSSFVMKHILSDGECNVTLQISDKKTWSARCMIDVYCGQLCARLHHHGWQAFVRDNQLEEGDACVFELIEKAPKIKLRVRIFRDKDQV
ncbi:B3 domain-containing transcription factor VRN1-like [Prunus avium]|uniref:B3 domain-containing transcription factor VRN1-like n=1 Tax=Prunus avium TaxID=42229 RepID=A0A6P5S6V1_PRUAV|nr:B3 domain-containing transcription factor VRN1-like [Prunus avium]